MTFEFIVRRIMLGTIWRVMSAFASAGQATNLSDKTKQE
jgi:hypothetical protein